LVGCKGDEQNFFAIQLTKPKYGVFNIKCDKCRDENFKMGNARFNLHPYYKFEHNGALPAKEKRWIVSESFCMNCVNMNMEITDIIMKNSKKNK
jgi:hypothetical protein